MNKPKEINVDINNQSPLKRYKSIFTEVKDAVLSCKLEKVEAICKKYGQYNVKDAVLSSELKKVEEMCNLPYDIFENICKFSPNEIFKQALNQTFDHKINYNLNLNYETGYTVLPYTPLICALVGQRDISQPADILPIIKIMVRYGCQLDKQNRIGHNALFYLFFQRKKIGKGVLLRYLLTNGLDPKICDVYGRNVYFYYVMLSRHNEQIDSISLMMLYGAINKPFNNNNVDTTPANPMYANWTDIRCLRAKYEKGKKNAELEIIDDYFNEYGAMYQ